MDRSDCCKAEMQIKNGEFVCSSCEKKYYISSRLPKEQVYRPLMSDMEVRARARRKGRGQG